MAVALCSPVRRSRQAILDGREHGVTLDQVRRPPPFLMVATNSHPVIASEAKQSIVHQAETWIASLRSQ